MRCEICKSPYRQEIERMYFEGYSPKQIAVYIENTYGVKYSVPTIKKHLESHLDPKNAIEAVTDVDRVLTSAEQRLMKLNEREELIEIIEDAKMLRQKAKKMLMSSTDLKTIEVWSKVWNVAAQRSIQAIKTVIEKTKSQEVKQSIMELLQQMWGASEEAN
ncbi:MAG TPA: hypothetical protein ENF81_07170 [Thermotogaceae bacterium]|nr:hypothetical protein [Thermotogaceae bacterium]